MSKTAVTVGNKMSLMDGRTFVPLEIFGKEVFGRVSEDGKSWKAARFPKDSKQFGDADVAIIKEATPEIQGLANTGSTKDGHSGYAGGY